LSTNILVDIPITSYIPTFQSTHEDKLAKFASVADVLSHSTGIPDFPTLYLGLDNCLLSKGDEAKEKILKVISNLPLQPNEFKEVWRYNALTYALPSMIIEKLCDTSFEEFLSARLFSPLGLSSTSLLHSTLPSDGNKVSAIPYVVMPDDSLKKIPLAQYGAGTHFAASCGMQSSVKDLLIWTKAIMDAWRRDREPPASPGHSHHILKEMKRILQPVCYFPPLSFGNASYALGWFQMVGQYISDEIFDDIPAAASDRMESSTGIVQPDRGQQNPNPQEKFILFHSGRIEGFTSSIHIFPATEDAVIVLANSTGYINGGDWIARLIVSILYDEGPPKDMQSGMDVENNRRRNRWNSMHQRLLQNKDLQGSSESPPTEAIIGTYLNESFGLEIYIFYPSCDRSFSGSSQHRDHMEAANSLYVSFFADHSHSIRLTHYHEAIYSFFPSRYEFEERARAPFQNESQFLLYLHLENGIALGLWWQYTPSQDGIWFQHSL
jgi:CubicO group peptidase (beta-lactamase class C family)